VVEKVYNTSSTGNEQFQPFDLSPIKKCSTTNIIFLLAAVFNTRYFFRSWAFGTSVWLSKNLDGCSSHSEHFHAYSVWRLLLESVHQKEHQGKS
jgi:hypothetical protein